MKLRTLIIEDEEPARLLLKNYIEKNTHLELIGFCTDGFNGVKTINEQKPDLVFLDIQMPKLTGFEVIELCEFKPIIIFTTAYDQYAVKAFELNATDYIMKPYTFERFNIAVNRVIDKINHQQINATTINSVINTIDEKPELIHRIAVRSGNKIHVIPSADVIFIESDGDYVQIHATDGVFLKEKTMKYFEKHLDSTYFIRIHRSYIVNMEFVERLEYYDKESYVAVMKNKEKLKVSSNGYKILKNAIKM